MAKTVFLDIACFFKGERIEYVKKILEEFGSTSNIKELVNKSLLTIEDGCLKMHDLIQDMGREIIRQEAPNPGQRSRLWFYEDVIEVLAGDSGSDSIQGIMLDPPKHEAVDWSGTAFKKMKWLRILIVRNTSFTLEPRHMPNHLRLLDWEEYPSKSLPPKFYPKKIIVFNLSRSQLTMEEPFKKFSCLTHMNFSHNQSITVLPDVSDVQNLRELRLTNCRNLITVHESVGFLKYLAHFSASGCTKLRNFLQRMFLPSLEVLDLNLCIKLEHFPDIVNNMNKPLKISMINTAIMELPNSIGNLSGLVSIEIPSSRKLKNLPHSLFMLPNVVAFKIGGCSQLRESFRRFLQSPSAPNGHPTLKTLYFGNSSLSDEDIHTILVCFPKLEELIASENNFVSLPACIKECVHLTNLDVSVCQKLQKIPECTNLRTLNVLCCTKLKHISELPSTIRKVDARYCFSLTRETSTMLWHQVLKEICGLEIVMPKTEIPEWFDYSSKGGNPRFWARGKFPIVVLAMVFQGVNGRARQCRQQLVELHLVINGQCVPRRGYYNFRMEADHVLICDLRLLFSEEERLGLDAFLEHEWNQVQVSYEAPSTMTLSCWGVYVYKQGTYMEDVQFMCPDPQYSYIASMPTIVPTRDLMQEIRKMIEESCLDEMFDRALMEDIEIEKRELIAYKKSDAEDFQVLLRNVKEMSDEAKDVLKGKALDDKNSFLVQLLEIMKKSDDEDEIKPPIDVGEASTSGRQGCSEVQGSDPQQQEIMMDIFSDGMVAGLIEAQSSFPSLDIDTTMVAALNKGNRVRWSQLESEVENQVEMKIYMGGIMNGLLEAKLSFPTLDIEATTNTVLSRGAYNRPTEAPPTFELLDWTKVIVPSSEDPLLQAFMMMKQESCESEAKTKLYWKLMQEHKALRKKFEELQNETAAPDKDSSFLPSMKNQYDELIQKLNTQPAQLITNKCHNLDGTALSSTEMRTSIGKEGCKGVTKTEKLGAVLKGRAEELRRLYDTGIEGFQNSEEFQDLMSAVYLNGMRDGLLEAQATLLALDMDRITPVFKENDEHASHEAAIDEHVTAEAADNENPGETIGKADIPSPTSPEVANPRDTSNISGSDLLEEFGHLFF